MRLRVDAGAVGHLRVVLGVETDVASAVREPVAVVEDVGHLLFPVLEFAERGDNALGRARLFVAAAPGAHVFDKTGAPDGSLLPLGVDEPRVLARVSGLRDRDAELGQDEAERHAVLGEDHPRLIADARRVAVAADEQGREREVALERERVAHDDDGMVPQGFAHRGGARHVDRAAFARALEARFARGDATRGRPRVRRARAPRRVDPLAAVGILRDVAHRARAFEALVRVVARRLLRARRHGAVARKLGERRRRSTLMRALLLLPGVLLFRRARGAKQRDEQGQTQERRHRSKTSTPRRL